MTISTSSPVLGATSGSLSDLYTSATQSLLARNPAVKLIDTQLQRDNARLSSLGRMALALDGFHNAAGGLSAAGMDMSASSSTKAVEASLSGATATAGSHTVEVRQLAQAQQLASKALAARDAPIGSGAVTVIKIDTGAASRSLRIDGSNNTLDGIAKAMRDAGLNAEVVQDGKGFALKLTGTSGAANGMRIGVSGDPALQGLLSYGNGGNSAMTEKAAAQDAQLVVDGKAVTASTNKVDNAIAGVSLTLGAVGKSEVQVARDPSAIAANVKNLVSAFNSMGSQLAALRSGDPGSDSALNQVTVQINQVLDAADPKALAGIGITRKSGALVLDEAKLKAAVGADPDKVTALFANGGKGLAEQLAKRAGQQIATGGTVANQAIAIKQDADKLSDRKAKIVDTVNRQASMQAQQYSLAGSGIGGNALFGNGQVKPTSLFDFMA